MKRSPRTSGLAAVITILSSVILGCDSGETPPPASIPAPPTEEPVPEVPLSDAMQSAFPIPDELQASSPYVAPEVSIETSLGDLRVRLHELEVPETVANFLGNYVDYDFYSETIFHHIDTEVLVAGGYTADLVLKETEAPIRNEAIRAKRNTRGTIGMMRLAESSDTATSQFYINLVDAPELDRDIATENDGYCVFGEVISGLEVLDKIARVPVHEIEGFPRIPISAVMIKSIKRVRP